MSSIYCWFAVGVAVLCAWIALNSPNTDRPQVSAPATSFYKLSLQWPPAACNSGRMTCKPPIPSKFTIHGIWPQDANDVEIPPYNVNNPSTSETPTPSRNLRNILLPIETDLTSLWPNLVNPRNRSINYKFWRKQWNKHGKCSDYPTEPLLYFSSALLLRDGLTDPVMGLQPGGNYTVQDVVDKVYNLVKAYPEIACNRNRVTKALQLWEIRLCYDRATPPQLPRTIRNCPHQLPKRNGSIVGPCKKMSDIINFPS